MPLLPNQILNNRYQILALLGQGGMGSVYRAFDQVLQRPVAIKEHIPDPNATPQGLAQARAQFQREARVLAKLHHDNLPRVTDYFSFGGNEYLVMDLIEGMGLDQVVQQHGAISEGAVRAWMNQVLDALIYIHSQNPPVIHRDIKPANLILKPDGKVTLVDFGLVKLLDPNNPRTLSAMRAMGTPEYAPIEQFSPGMHTDARSDIYSLGATMYHLLSGRPPLDVPRRLVDPTQMPNLRAINPNVSPQMEWVVHKALEIQPQNRFQSAAEMKQALATTATVPAPPQLPSPPYVPPPPPPPRQTSAPLFPVLAGIAGAVVVLLCVVLAIALMTRQPNSVALAPTSTTFASASPTAVPTSAPTSMTAASRPPTAVPTATPLVIVVTATPIPTPTATAKPRSTLTNVPTQTETPLATPWLGPSAAVTPTASMLPTAISDVALVSPRWYAEFKKGERVPLVAKVDFDTSKYVRFEFWSGTGEFEYVVDNKKPVPQPTVVAYLITANARISCPTCMEVLVIRLVKPDGNYDELWGKANIGYYIR